jgi:hypothetical protein
MLDCPYKDCPNWYPTRCLRYESCAMETDAITKVKEVLKRLQRKETHYVTVAEWKEIEKCIEKLESVL